MNPRYQTPSSYLGKTGPYRGPVGHPPPARNPLPPRRPTGPPGPPAYRPPGMTAQQWADAQAQRIVDEQLAAIRSQQEAYNASLQERARQQALDAQKFAQMVQALGIDKQIQGIYGSAGRDIAGLAQGFAGSIRDTAAADAAAQTRMVSGTGQEGAVRNEGTGMGDVIYGVGGWIPGQTMGQAGAAAAADAARQPGFMLEQRVGDAQKALNEGLQSGGQSFLDAITKVNLGKTDIASGLYKQKVDTQLAAMKFEADKANDDRTYWLKMQALYLSQKKTKLAADAAKRAAAAEKRYANATMGRDAEGNVAPGFVQRPDGTIVKRSDLARQESERRQRMKDKGLAPDGTLLPGFKRDAKGNVVKTYKPSTAGAAGMTPNAKAEALTRALGYEKTIVKTDLPALAKQVGLTRLAKEQPGNTKEIARLKKSVARALWVRYAERATTPQAKKALRRMIDRVVRTYDPAKAGSSLLGDLTS